MHPLPTFPLFPDPLREKVFEKSSKPCSVCNQARGMLYTAELYGKGDRSPCCPWCIADGSAAAAGFSFIGHVRCASGEYRSLSQEDKALLDERTHGYLSWQGCNWLLCCDKPCIYLGEADDVDLEGRWASVVPTLEAVSEWPADKIAQFVKNVTRGESPAVYVFQCQICRKLKGDRDRC
jgi:uncharacterized protein CbrC (UPF0167 family)